MISPRIAGVIILAISGMTYMTASAETDSPIAIAIHGGAGTIKKEDLTAEKEAEIRLTLDTALRAGYGILRKGGTSVDAVTRAVKLLEDSPDFNAGKGAVFNAEGKNELDASIMEGRNLEAGAVAAVRNIRNPILLARKVMTDSVHVMLMGSGAEQFARDHGIAFEADDYFYTERRWQQLQDAKSANEQVLLSETPGRWYSTVGAVALDRDGNLAAATSTGG